MPEKFIIELENPDHTFSPGEIIVGRVIIELSRPKTIRGIKMQIKGKGKVSWSTGSGRTRTNHSSKEEYFHMKFYMIGQADGERIEMQSGRHELPFNFCLPRNLPSSFETDHGSVRYTIKVAMDIPWQFDPDTFMLFDVESPHDLSQLTAETTGIQDEHEETFCSYSCYCSGAELRIQISLPSCGFAVGEIIQANINLYDINGNAPVVGVELHLNQVITLHAHGSKKETSTTIQSCTKNGPFGKIEEFTMSMEVPLLPCSSMTYCKLIDIQYYLKFIFPTDDCSCSVKLVYPIVIGTRPALNVHSTGNGIVNTVPIFPIGTTNPMNNIPMPLPRNLSSKTGQDDNAGVCGSSTSNRNFESDDQSHLPALPGAMGFVAPNSSRSVDTFEPPPPSYNEIMKTSEML